MLRNPNNPNANPHPTLEAFTTPLGPPPPPPPLSLSTSHGRSRQPNQNFPAYAGARHTLGPTFSEEEDGDDSEFIAEKMANLGLGKYGQGQGQGQDLGQGSQNVGTGPMMAEGLIGGHEADGLGIRSASSYASISILGPLSLTPSKPESASESTSDPESVSEPEPTSSHEVRQWQFPGSERIAF